MSYDVIIRTVVRHDAPAEDSRGEASPDLRKYLANLLQFEPVVVRPSIIQRSTIRRWHPSGKPNISALNLKDRHPHFETGEDLTPVRKVPRLAQSPKMGWRGYFQSHKMDRSMQFYNLSELWALQACEADPVVADFVEHPICLLVDHGGRHRRVRLSTFVTRKSECWFLLGMREQTASKEPRTEFLEKIGQTLSTHGFGFEVLTELHRREEPLAKTVFDILRGRGTKPLDQARVDFAVALANAGATVGDIEDRSDLDRNDICRLILNRQLFVNIRKPLDHKTLISPTPFADPIPPWSAR
ncbi:hypothetical protein K3175_05615 [Qipengyuania sp. GH1]|uniref:hypothetical protein n=1 Tax=Qipengyuania aestuarii TaxID=2867241 RepID=UPI001C87F3D7|nr:hypothetical protein [Qipengyuania aestuarii]MBX7535130.1 hypothetical protein [Qipengyuania aestuarii]